MKKIVFVIMILCLSIPSIVFAHSGGTDANGGHHDYNNVSGLGSYHYHHGYGPHLHDGGVCPYDAGRTSTTTYSSYDYDDEEEFSFTEDELFYYVKEQVFEDPERYDMVPVHKYEELQKNYNFLRDSSVDADKATNNVFTAIGVTGAIGALACYYVYKKYNK